MGGRSQVKLVLAGLAVTALAGCGGAKLEVIEPAVSPDGRAIAFVGFRGDNIYGRNAGDIYVLRLGGKPRRITRSDSDDSWPAWSSDGSKLAFDREGEIFVINVDGTDLRRVAAGWLPTWVPGKAMIAFGAGRYLGAVDADGRGYRVLVNDEELAEFEAPVFPAWSPDGSRVAYVRGPGRAFGRQIVVFNLRTKESRVVATSPRRSISGPVWSPDGQRLAFTDMPLDAPATRILSDKYQELYLVNADGSGRTRLTFNHVGEGRPSWTPDGRIVFERSARIYVMSADGTNVHRLYGKSGSWPSWTPIAIVALVALGALVGIAGYTYEKVRQRTAPTPPATQ